MSVQIHINGDSAVEAVKELSALASHLGGGQAIPETASAAEVPAETRKSRTRTKPDPEPEKPAKQDAQDDVAEAPPEDDGVEQEEIPTVVELRAKAQEVGKTPEQKKAIKALLDEFESKSISDVPEDKRAAFMKRLEEME